MLALAYVLLLALVAFGVPLGLSLRNRVDAEVKSQAASQAGIVASTVSDILASSGRAKLSALVQSAATQVRGRVIVVDRFGAVLADSGTPAATGQSYASRPEIVAALRGHSYQKTRHSSTLSADILATSTPVLHGGRTVGAVRVTQSISSVTSAVWKALGGLALIGAVVLMVGLAAGLVIAEQVARPLKRLNLAVRRIASGDLHARAPVEGSSEQRSLARSFNDMTERLAGSISTQRRFVADASHQLRTPLTGLRLRVEEAQAAEISPRARHELDEGLQEIDRLADMVDELLVLSRADERPNAAAQVVELRDVADRAVERWRASAEERGVLLTRSPDRDPGTVSAHAPDVDRALDSLVENALNYSPAGGEVQVLVVGGVLDVLDRGEGLATGEETDVFERFHRGHAGRAGPPGTGLGLAIARELVQRWGGAVTLTPRPGGGVLASLTFETVDRSKERGEWRAAPVA